METVRRGGAQTVEHEGESEHIGRILMHVQPPPGAIKGTQEANGCGFGPKLWGTAA